jgi:hypothetical protein
MQPVRRGQRIASRTTTTQRIAQYNDRASHPVQLPRIASRTTTAQRIAQMEPVRRGPRIASRTTTAHRPPRSAHRLVSFRLVRGTNFSKIPYRYIFIPDIFMAHPSYWLRCENLICGPRFDSGTSRVIVVGPRRRPCCNDDFTTAEK